MIFDDSRHTQRHVYVPSNRGDTKASRLRKRNRLVVNQNKMQSLAAACRAESLPSIKR